MARPLRIALISPKGPLYRHRGGIWKKSLRYQPLTLTTLAALIPQDLPHEVALYDEGIVDVPVDGSIAWTAGAMDHSHGDPADRLIMATAMSRSAKLVTADREILRHRDELRVVDSR